MKNPNQKRSLINKLCDIKMIKDDTNATYFMKISQLKEQLISIGEIVDDKYLVVASLDGLLLSWVTYVQGINSQENQPSFHRLWTDYLQEEGRIMNRSGPPNEENQVLASNVRKCKGRKSLFKKKKDKIHASNHDHRSRDMSKVKGFNSPQVLTLSPTHHSS